MSEELDQRLLRDVTEVEQSLSEGRYREGALQLRAAQALVETAGSPPSWWTFCLCLQARLALVAGRLDQAETTLKEALELAETHLTANKSLMGLVLADVAVLRAAQQRWSDSEQVANRAVAMLSDKPLAYWHPLSQALLALAECRLAASQWDGAETVIRQALELTERGSGGNSPLMRVALRCLGVLHCRREEFQQAEATFRKYLRLQKQARPAELGGTIQTYCDLADIYRIQGRKNRRTRAIRRAWRLARRCRHRRSLAASQTLSLLSTLLLERGQAPRAERVARFAVKLAEKILGPEHVDVANRLHELGHAQVAQEKYGEAEQTYRRALSIGQRACGPHWRNNAVCQTNLAMLVGWAGRIEEAERFLRQALASREENLGPTHPLTVASRQRLAELFHFLGRSEEEAWLSLPEPDSPVEVPAPAVPEKSQAELLAQVNKHMLDGQRVFRPTDLPLAEQHFRAAVAAARQLDPLDPCLGQALYWLACTRAGQGDYDEGERLARRALVIIEQADSENPYIVAALDTLVYIFSRTGREEQAVPFLQRGCALAERQLQPSDVRLFERVAYLANLLARVGRLDEAAVYHRRALELRGQKRD